MHTSIRLATVTFGLATFVSAIGWFSYQNMVGSHNTIPTGLTPDQETALRSRGAYLMASMGCNDCHSPRDNTGKFIPGREFTGQPENAPSPTWDPSMLEKGNLMTMGPTGTSFAGPWGVSYAANITPDKETGIGNLTADALIRSWRTGQHWKENRPILPIMPFEAFANLTDDDIRALHSFLMSLPPTKNRVPDAKIAPPPPAKG